MRLDLKKKKDSLLKIDSEFEKKNALRAISYYPCSKCKSIKHLSKISDIVFSSYISSSHLLLEPSTSVALLPNEDLSSSAANSL